MVHAAVNFAVVGKSSNAEKNRRWFCGASSVVAKASGMTS